MRYGNIVRDKYGRVGYIHDTNPERLQGRIVVYFFDKSYKVYWPWDLIRLAKVKSYHGPFKVL